MYHKIRYGNNNQDAKKNKPKGGWDEDDKDYSIKSNSANYSTQSNYQRPSVGRPDINVEKPNTNNYSSYNYTTNANHVQAKATISIEQRLIYDLLQPTGIIIKPSENQLKEFAKRVKSLDKEIIFEILYEKLLNYENMSDANNSKVLMKCFYILEFIAQNKIEPLNQAFAERLEKIENIRDYFSNNKKLVDLANSVIHTFNPSQNKSSTPVNSINLISEEPIRKKFDLLNFNQTKKEENSGPQLLDLEIIKSTEPTKTNINLLNNIFDVRDQKIQANNSPFTSNLINNINTSDNNQKSFKFLKKTNKSEHYSNTISNSNPNIFSVLGTENTNGNNSYLNVNSNGIGNFISNMPNIPNLTNIPSNNESAPKKNFVFVKSKDKEKYQTLNTNTSSINSILGLQETESKLTNTTQSYQATNFDIFDSLPVNISNQPIQQDNFNKNIINSISDSVPIIDMTKNLNQQSNTNNSTNFDEIFNTGHQSSINPTIYQQDRYNLKNIDMSSANDFNYNHLGNHVEIYKSNSDKKDAFSFVGDMLKSNKN